MQIIKLIRKLAREKSKPEQEIVEKLEEYRLVKDKSIDWMCKNISKVSDEVLIRIALPLDSNDTQQPLALPAPQQPLLKYNLRMIKNEGRVHISAGSFFHRVPRP